jgi:hypothetical protein
VSLPDATQHDLQVPLEASIGLAFPLVALVGMAFWNRGTTISVATIPLAVVISLTSIPAFFRVIYHWFRPRERLDPPPHWNLKHDSPGTWALTGIGLAVSIAVLVGWAVYNLAGMAVQHVPGKRIELPATVTLVEEVPGRRSVCYWRAEFAVGWRDTLASCVDPKFGASVLDSHPLTVGDPVTLTLTDNVLGTALSRVSRRSISDDGT